MRNLPDKIWLSEDRTMWLNNQYSTEYTEYVRKDAFIEKACETFCKVKCNDKPPRSTCTSLGTCFEHDEFRKALKGE